MENIDRKYNFKSLKIINELGTKGFTNSNNLIQKYFEPFLIKIPSISRMHPLLILVKYLPHYTFYVSLMITNAMTNMSLDNKMRQKHMLLGQI